jgi:hypothetical protein
MRCLPGSLTLQGHRPSKAVKYSTLSAGVAGSNDEFETAAGVGFDVHYYVGRAIFIMQRG